MINAKAIYNELLNDESILELVEEDSIFDSSPSTIEKFPCICFTDSSQADEEYADNRHTFQRCVAEVHIFTKALEGFPTTSEIGVRIADVFNADWWHCSNSVEVPDPEEDVRHRVMTFSRDVFLDEQI
ncbi:MAG: hypothetical protein IKY42_05370 [Bacteroidaceae bacterium]|nr:hypothetical protein [Bacteroidaceae bacterium]